MLTSGQVSANWLLSDGRVVFVANPEDGGSSNLYIINPDGSGLQKLSGRNFHDGATILNAKTVPGETSIRFISNRYTAVKYELFEVSIP